MAGKISQHDKDVCDQMMSDINNVIVKYAERFSPELTEQLDALGSIMAAPLIVSAWSLAARSKIRAGKGTPEPKVFADACLYYAKAAEIQMDPKRFALNTKTGVWTEVSSVTS